MDSQEPCHGADTSQAIGLPKEFDWNQRFAVPGMPKLWAEKMYACEASRLFVEQKWPAV
jgi:hypothetical protein